MPLSPSTEKIARAACLHLEVTAPSSVDDDSALARDLSAFYPEARDRCLEACDWSFASTFALLPELAGLPVGAVMDPDLPFNFALPNDLRKILEVGTMGRTKWRRDAGLLRADEPGPLRLRYTATSPAESLWPAEFRNAVGLVLATILAPKWLTGDGKLQRLLAQADDALDRAKRNSAADASPARYDGEPEQNDWVTEARW